MIHVCPWGCQVTQTYCDVNATDANLSVRAAGVSRWIHHHAPSSVPSESRRRSSSHQWAAPHQ